MVMRIRLDGKLISDYSIFEGILKVSGVIVSDGLHHITAYQEGGCNTFVTVFSNNMAEAPQLSNLKDRRGSQRFTCNKIAELVGVNGVPGKSFELKVVDYSSGGLCVQLQKDILSVGDMLELKVCNSLFNFEVVQIENKLYHCKLKGNKNTVYLCSLCMKGGCDDC